MNNFILNMLGKQPIEVIYNMLIKSNPQLKQTVLAKNFLDDKDFDGDGKEKLMLYYKCIVEKDDE